MHRISSSYPIPAARLLVPGGRLVYFYPCVVEEYHPLDLPTHPCLELLHNSEDPISTRFSRRLITLRKVRPWHPGAKAEAAAADAARAEERARAGLGEVTVGPDGLRKYVSARPSFSSLLSFSMPHRVPLRHSHARTSHPTVQIFYGDKTAVPGKQRGGGGARPGVGKDGGPAAGAAEADADDAA